MSYPRTGFQRWLRLHGACRGGRAYAGNRTPQQVWSRLNRPNYMSWLIHKLEGDGYLSPLGAETLSRVAWKCGCAAVRKLVPALPEFKHGVFHAWKQSQLDRLLPHWRNGWRQDPED